CRRRVEPPQDYSGRLRPRKCRLHVTPLSRQRRAWEHSCHASHGAEPAGPNRKLAARVHDVLPPRARSGGSPGARAGVRRRPDRQVVEGDLRPRRLPVIPGHQVVGIVDARGAGATRFRIGDRVGIAWLRSTCGRCRFCLADRENLCAESTYIGWTHDGGYAEQACVPEAFAYAIPSGFDDAEATPLLCAGIIGYRALGRSQVPRGGRLGLYGFGSSAHITLQVALHWGCEVYVITREVERRRLALELGAAWAGSAEEPPPKVLDGAIVFAPVGSLVPVALRALDKGGTVALAAIP